MLVSNGSTIVVFFGLIAIVLAIGLASGAHVNPAITIGAWATRRIDSVRAVAYLVSQVLGAMAALVIISAFVGAAPETAANSQMALFGQAATPEVFKLGEIMKDKEWLLLAAELIGTALFAFGFAAVSRDKNRAAVALGVSGSLFIGLTVASYLAGVATGAANNMGPAVLNPAVATALQGLAGTSFTNLWPLAIFLVAPAIGGVIGFGLRDLIDTEGRAKA